MTENNEMSKLKLIALVVRDGLMYAFVETILLVMFLIQRFTGDGLIWEPLLWGAFVLAAGWVLTTVTEDSYVEAKSLVLSRDLFMSDFMVSAFLLCLLALLSYSQAWYFGGMFLIAAGQNLLYTKYAMQWILEEKRDRDRPITTDTDDHLP